MRIVLIICLLFSYGFSAKAQKKYAAHQTDLIFSLSSMNTTNDPTSAVMRFSGFLNHEEQLHFDFGKTIGMYTGLGVKNIGFINRFENHKTNFKQRAYALGIPLAIKIGHLNNQAFVALGGELNLMVHYKQKFLYNDTKIKSGEWFSDKVTLLNPAIFLQIKFLKSQTITFKYFLNDFLQYQSSGLTLPNGTLISDYGRSSKLFYISWGSHVAIKDPQAKKEQELQKLKSARSEY
jgi:hypothetical protein